MTGLSYKRGGQGAPLVLIHGYLGGSAMWTDQIRHFEHDFDVIAPDLPGFGESAALTGCDSIRSVAQQVLSFLTDLGIESFTLLGHSMGGMVVQQMAADAPKRIEKLICYGTGPVGALPGRFETIDESRERLKQDGVPVTASRIAATWFSKGDKADAFAVCRELGARVSMETALHSLTAWETWDGRAALSAIRCRTLVMWGDRDKSYDWDQPQALWRGISNSDLAVLPGCAHNAHLEKPVLFNAILEDFVNGQ
tara:strand:- start:4944 stop:5702 length:759 start_codon:yes stop_codon:yes gene_type:complete